ncbi:ATP-binding cassette domain-containing protein [Pseudomonas sp. PB120]|uniref:ABC transporter ATP-binding protein n=1 Tax=Pseudomonas sp. PB120 TaxID=2494700 RepID=UPI0012FDE4FB|nr:ATP-binding cassette domain-containing protein [Pseudomonas sp. PB120]MVV48336.1 ATP-binding cassette domain-containing protein [Pseudomonas sp. PB120]
MNNIIDLTSVDKSYYLARETTGIASWCKQLIKPSYNSYQALSGINLTVPKGAAVGFIGPNGAGKSSLIKILCGIQKPTSGTVRVLGHNPALREKEFLNKIGVVFGHKTSLWWDLPVKTSLDTYKEIYKIKDSDYSSRLEELSTALNLGNVLHKPVRNLSLGERVKCELTLNLLHSPSLIFLDEPTVGLDVTSKYEIRRYLNYKRKESNLSVFLTSHDLGDIESCCDDAIIIDKGRIRFDGSMHELSANFKANVKLTVSPLNMAQSECDLLKFKETIGAFQNISLINDAPTQVVYLVPKVLLGAVFEMFHHGIYDLEISPMDFENNVVNLFKSWSSE